MNWSQIIGNMIDGEVVLEMTALGLGTGLSALFYYFHQRQVSAAERIKKTPLRAIDQSLLSDVDQNGAMPYVAVCGRIKAEGKPISSRYFPDKEGVVVNFITEERKETWAKYSQAWYESDKELSNIFDTIPFQLVEKDETSVLVCDPLQSTWCKDSLEVINKEFRSPDSSVFSSIIGLVSGDRVKGYTDTEKMLRVGTQLLGIGELALEDGVLKLRKPMISEGEYIITRATREEVVTQFRSRSKLWKLFCMIFLGATAAGLYYFLKRLRKKYKEAVAEARRQQEVEQIRKHRASARGAGNASERNAEGEPCVVCLTNPRECVILDCGHICACVDCIEVLPKPKLCPMCRSPIDKIVPLFYA